MKTVIFSTIFVTLRS